MGKRFIPADLRRMNYLSFPMLSPQGDKIAYVVKSADESGRFVPQVHILNRTSGETTILPPDTAMPCFLPDGNRLTALSAKSGEMQVHLFDLTTGENEQITHLRHGVTRYHLSQNGDKIVFEATLWPHEVAQGLAFSPITDAEKADWEADLDITPYTVTELVYKMDEWYGMRKGEFSHIGIASLAGCDAQILPVGMEAVYPAFSPDADVVAFYGYPYHDARGHQVELFTLDLRTGEMKQRSSGLYISADHAPIFTPDGRGLITFAYGGAVPIPFLIDLADGSCRALMEKDDETVAHGVHPLVTNKTENGENDAYAALSADGQALIFLSSWHGRTNLCRLSLTPGSRAELYLAGETDIQAFSMNAAGQIALLQCDLTHPARLYMDGEMLADHNEWLRDYPQGKTEEYVIRSRDGKVDLHYFLVRPAFQREGELYPAVLDIKGGPTTMYTAAYWHEFHALAAAGFAVIYGNPRGSVGFGHAFCSGGVCWSPEAMHDLEDMLADAIAKGFIDEKRVGVTGGSYGGYMTNKLIGRTKHFAAAVTQRSLVNPATSYGTGDMGFVSAGDIPKHFSMLDYLEDRARGNPLTYVDNMKLPLLILHAFKDYRCSFEQGEQLFIAMKERNPEIPCRLVMFPEENHALTRTGKLKNQIRHLEELIGWFEKYLGKEAEANA